MLNGLSKCLFLYVLQYSKCLLKVRAFENKIHLNWELCFSRIKEEFIGGVWMFVFFCKNLFFCLYVIVCRATCRCPPLEGKDWRKRRKNLSTKCPSKINQTIRRVQEGRQMIVTRPKSSRVVISTTSASLAYSKAHLKLLSHSLHGRIWLDTLQCLFARIDHL